MNNYLEQEKLEETRRIIRVITFRMALPLFFVFWFLDLLYVPQYKWEFLGLRLLILPTAFLTSWWLGYVRSYRQAEMVGLFLLFMCGALLHMMTYVIGKDSLYVIALHLVAIGGLSFIPWSRGYFILALLLIYVPYYAIELSHQGGGADVDRILVNSFFIAGVVSITWVIHTYREQLRLRELEMRRNLENEVAQRKQTEQALIEARDQALAATQAKESFLANMSHEIRTPLTAIMGFAEHALDKDLTEPERMNALNTIVGSSHHLLNIINDILDFSKIEANSFDLESIAMDPMLLAADVQSLVLPLAGKKGLQIKLTNHYPLPARIHSDPVRIKQILINLCSNAIKFTEHGTISITLEYDSANALMCYRVKDSGIGMTPEQQARIFEPFKQADSSITRRYGGTGLGLSLSRRLAELLGGTLTVTSEHGVGSEFVLAVAAGDSSNMVMVNNAEDIGQHAVETRPESEFYRLHGRVLLAEDNENNQRLLSLYLDKMGLQVCHAENGAVAVRLAGVESPDLILMDMQMPVLSGLDAARQIRANGYTRPILALTANATQEDRRQCLEAGCDDFLTKPVTRERLYQMLAQYLGRQILPQSGVEPLPSELSEEGPEFVEIVCQFVNKLPEQVASIETAYRNNDREKLREVVHNLKGMGGGFGYPQLTEKAVEIERLLGTEEYGAVAPVIAVLQQLTRRIQAAMPHCMSP